MYELVVQATDLAGNTSNQALTVTVTDDDDDDSDITFTPAGSHVVEDNDKDGYLYFDENNLAIGTATSTTSYTWSISGADADKVSVSSDGVISFLAAPDYENPIDADADNIYEGVFTATDLDGTSLDQHISIIIKDVNENSPLDSSDLVINGITNGRLDLIVDENIQEVYTFTANKSVTWSLKDVEGNEADYLLIEPSTGVLSFINPPDYENPFIASNNYDIGVVATDIAGNSTEAWVEVVVNDIDEALSLIHISEPTRPY